MHGNGGTLSWKESHMNQNAGGLSSAAKRKQLIDLDFDILAICETHLQAHLHSSISEQFSHSNCTFSPDPESRHFQGVSIFTKKSKFWQSIPITWSESDPCFEFWKARRLCATQAWFGHGGTSLIIYCAYFPSGSRWEVPKRHYFHRMFEAITVQIRCLEVRSLLCSLETLICRSMKIPFSQLRCIRKAGITLPT